MVKWCESPSLRLGNQVPADPTHDAVNEGSIAGCGSRPIDSIRRHAQHGFSGETHERQNGSCFLVRVYMCVFRA